MNCYLGVDIGTTAVKTVAFAPNGEVIAKAEQAFPMHHPQPDRSEQDPDEIFRAVCTTVRKVVNHCQDYSVLFISFSAAMHSLIALNKDGKRLTECIIWADNRAADIASKLKASQSFPAIYQRTGVPVHAMSPLCKSMWLREHEPDIFGATDKLLGIKEFVIHRLTGQFLIDAGVASATGFLNTNTLQWDQLALDLAGVQARQLPKVVPVSFQCTLTAEGAGQLGVPVATKLVMGGSDGAMANIGTPMSMNDGLVITIGTSTAARVLTSRPGTDEAMRTFCYHAREGLYLVGGGGNSGGIVLQWLRESVLQSTVPMEEMLSLAEGAPPCADGLVFLPYLLGERSPIWNEQARAVFFGLAIHHQQSHMVRAAMEGVIFGLYTIGKVLMETHPVKAVYATGGFARSKLWLQIVADVFQRPVVVVDAVETSALGAVSIGLSAFGLPNLPVKEPEQILEPDPHRKEIYERAFNRFQRLYTALEPEFGEGK